MKCVHLSEPNASSGGVHLWRCCPEPRSGASSSSPEWPCPVVQWRAAETTTETLWNTSEHKPIPLEQCWHHSAAVILSYCHTATNNALSYAFQLRYQTVHVLRKKTSYGNVIYDMYCSVTQVILPYMSPIKQYIIFIYVHVLSEWVCVSLAGLIMHCVYDCDWSTYCSYWSCVVLNWIMLELSVFSWLINRLKY